MIDEDFENHNPLEAFTVLSLLHMRREWGELLGDPESYTHAMWNMSRINAELLRRGRCLGCGLIGHGLDNCPAIYGRTDL